MRSLYLVLALALPGCLRSPHPPQVPVEDDRSIIFPQFFEKDAIEVGSQGGPYELDGETLRALMIAANDFLPLGAQNPPCRNRREAQFYRVIRQSNIIFIYIHENPAFCGRQYPAMDSGVKYAISTDGRILRRILDGERMGPFDSATSDGGPPESLVEPGSSPILEAMSKDGGYDPSLLVAPPAPSSSRDGGSPGVR